MLTEKQDKFCLNIVAGMSQTDAYKNSHNAENMSIEAIYVEASRLMDNPKIALRIEELRKEARKEVIMNTIQRKEWLTNLIMQDEKASKTDKLKALDILNKMDGEYVTKIQGEVELADIRVELRDD
jgi:phage terminase small subunit